MNSSRTRQAPALLLASLALLGVLALLTGVGAATANPIQSKRAQAQAVLAQIHAVRRPAREGDRVVQLRERPARPDRHRPPLEREPPRRRPEEPQHRPGAHRRPVAGAVRERRRRRRRRDPPRGPEPRRPARPARHGAARRRPGREGARRREGVPQGGQAAAGAAEDAHATSRPRSWPSARARSRSIESQLAERQRMLAGIQSEIKQLQAEEARRQAQLAAEAEARLAAQQRAAVDGRARRRRPSRPTASPPRSTAAHHPTSLIPAAPPSQYGGVVGLAMQELGKPYVWGAAGPDVFDCSGLVTYVYAQVGVSLPHNAAAQYGYGIAGRLRRPPAGRPRLLRGPRPRRHLHRRRPVHPRAAHGRRRQDLEPQRARRLRRRPPPLEPGAVPERASPLRAS